jgi:hypothetical protein
VGFLSPLFLALGAGAAVPLLIHLLRRRTGVRVEFPAVRYLARAEQEHSRRLKLRNLLLMLLRVLAVACIAIAAARPVGRAWGAMVGAGHAPAAIAIVLDNSLSTSVVVDGRPVLDGLKAVAQRVASRASPGDRLWLVTADGRTQGGSPSSVSTAISRTEALAGAGNMPRSVANAASLARSSGATDPVVAVVTDGQATAWPGVTDAGGVRIVAYAPDAPPPANRAVTMATAQPTRWTPRGEIAATVSGRARSAADDSTSYRITLGPRTLARGIVAVPPVVGGAGRGGVGTISVRAAPPERGWVAGSVELEPDELRGDDVRYFAMWIGEPPVVAVDSSVGPFLRSAAEALIASGRASVGPVHPPARPIAVVPADRLTELPALITAPTDPVRLGAANRALERAGVPWRFGAPARGEATVEGLMSDAGTSAAESTSTRAPVTAPLRYPLQPQAAAAADTLARTGTAPWVVAGPGYVIVASPIDPNATTWPLRAGFVPWVGDIVGQRLAGTSGGLGGRPAGLLDEVPGAAVRRPSGADELESPDGTVRVLSGATIEAPAHPGVYFVRRAGVRVGAVVVNPESGESDLARIPPSSLARHFNARTVRTFADPVAWSGAVFDAAAERPLAGLFITLAIAFLIAESLVTRRRANIARANSSPMRRAA